MGDVEIKKFLTNNNIIDKVAQQDIINIISHFKEQISCDIKEPIDVKIADTEISYPKNSTLKERKK